MGYNLKIFPVEKSTVDSKNNKTVVRMLFDAMNSRQIIEYFAKARRRALGQVKIEIEPLHKPERLTLSLVGGEPQKKLTGTFQYGFAVDEAGGGAEGLTPALPFVPVDPQGLGGSDDDQHWTSFQKQSPSEITIAVEGDKDGQPILILEAIFPQNQLSD
jgi:hypothetical protein